MTFIGYHFWTAAVSFEDKHLAMLGFRNQDISITVDTDPVPNQVFTLLNTADTSNKDLLNVWEMGQISDFLIEIR